MGDLNNFKDIHIGRLIQKRLLECNVDIDRACNFLKASEEEVLDMFDQKSLGCDILLLWSKLLRYDFFRIYSQHLILYAPQDSNKVDRQKERNSSLPVFKKNIYTHEVILYLVGLVESGRMGMRDIQQEYNIPATTILRWVNKYGNNVKGYDDENKKKGVKYGE